MDGDDQKVRLKAIKRDAAVAYEGYPYAMRHLRSWENAINLPRGGRSMRPIWQTPANIGQHATSGAISSGLAF